MIRYIDAEWIRNVYADFEHYENRDDWTTPIANVLAVIDDAPSIDIVRCKDCKYWVSDGGALMKCDIHKDPTVPDHYCSYGEEDKDE